MAAVTSSDSWLAKNIALEHAEFNEYLLATHVLLVAAVLGGVDSKFSVQLRFISNLAKKYSIHLVRSAFNNRFQQRLPL